MLDNVRNGRPLYAIFGAIGIAWILAIIGQLSGSERLIHHDALIEGGLPMWVALPLFILAWQAMIAAMMLPSSLPLIRMFAVTSAGQPKRGLVIAAFIGGYVAIWTAFGVAAFSGDIVVHRLVDRWSWLAERPWLIASGVLALAGVFQLSKFKDACLSKCRLPGMYLLHHYRRGIAGAFALGRDHGIFCVGCCWALMLVSFAAGFTNLWWMVALTALMAYEKIGKYGKRIVSLAGVSLIALAALVALNHSWLPSVLSAR